jgi:hypothetical protein
LLLLTSTRIGHQTTPWCKPIVCTDELCAQRVLFPFILAILGVAGTTQHMYVYRNCLRIFFDERLLLTGKYSTYQVFLSPIMRYGQKHNSTMVFDASPGTAAPKMNKSFVHVAHVSSNGACPLYGYLKRPHSTITDGDMRWDSGCFLGGFGVGGHQTCN